MTFAALPLKYVASLNDDKLPDSTDPEQEFRYLDIGSVGRGYLAEQPESMTFDAAPSRARRLVAPGDTIVSTVRTYLRAVWAVEGPTDDLVVSTGFAVVRPRKLDAAFLRWAVQADTFIEEVVGRSTGVSYPAINPGDLAMVHVHLPPAPQQRHIAGFLDDETARIDALIAAKRRMIEVTEALARDYAETASLGGASLDLSGSVPRYVGQPSVWKTTLLRHLRCNVQTGPFGSQLHSEEYVEGGWPVVNPANLRRGVIERIDTMCISDEKREELARHKLELYDIVFGRRGEMGRAGLAEADHVGWLCGTGSLRLRVRDDRIDPHFMKLQLETTAVRSYLLINSVGSTMDNLNSDIVLGVPLVVPDLETQRQVVEGVMRRRALAGSITATLSTQIGLLRERRQALITAAVTGEIEA